MLQFKHRTFNTTDLLYFIHFLKKHFSKNSSLENAFTDGIKTDGGNVINGSYWMPTPSGNPLTMIIPGILVGAISKLFVVYYWCICLFDFNLLISKNYFSNSINYKTDFFKC